MMSSGYKPSPLDLSHIKLTPQMENLVEKLADNAHNVWARERVKQGWTYGVNLVSMIFCSLFEINDSLLKLSFCRLIEKILFGVQDGLVYFSKRICFCFIQGCFQKAEPAAGPLPSP